ASSFASRSFSSLFYESAGCVGNPFVFLDPDTLIAPAPVIGETMYLPGDASTLRVMAGCYLPGDDYPARDLLLGNEWFSLLRSGVRRRRLTAWARSPVPCRRSVTAARHRRRSRSALTAEWDVEKNRCLITDVPVTYDAWCGCGGLRPTRPSPPAASGRRG